VIKTVPNNLNLKIMQMESKYLKWILLASALIIFALVSFGSPDGKDEMPVTTSSPKAKALFLEARDLYFEKGDFERCDELIRQALEIDDKFAVANTWRAFMGVGNTEQEKFMGIAAGQLDNVSEPERRFIKSYLAIMKVNYDEAVSEMEAAVAAAPRDRYLLVHMSMIYRMIGKNEDALEAAKLSGTIDNNFASAYFHQGYTLWLLKKYDEAETFFLRAIEMQPHHTGFLNNYGLFLKSMDRIDEAIKIHRKALAIREDYQSLLTLGHCYVESGDYPSGRDYYMKAFDASQLVGEKSYCLMAFAATYLYESKLNEAMAGMDRREEFLLKESDYNDLVVNGDINKAYCAMFYGDFENSEKYIRDMKEHVATLELPEAVRNDYLKYSTLVDGYNYAYSGNSEMAEKLLHNFEAGLSESEKSIYEQDIYEMKGLIEFHRGNYREALVSLEKGYVMANYYAGLVYEKLGEAEKAKETYSKILADRHTNMILATTKPFAKKRLAQL
jgi:tetratricopeptide (TPR) repeat protein